MDDETDARAFGAVIFATFVVGMAVGVMYSTYPEMLLLGVAALLGTGLLGVVLQTFDTPWRPT